VDYKDWPLLDWGWVKEMCEFGTIQAAKTGRWTWIATSNFCGPQFAGMWRDVDRRQRLTRIKSPQKLKVIVVRNRLIRPAKKSGITACQSEIN